MQTIETRYLTCPATLGACFKATAAGGYSVTIPDPVEATQHLDGHLAAATALVRKLGWSPYCHVGASREGEIWACAKTIFGVSPALPHTKEG